jgi:hypothetical protein
MTLSLELLEDRLAPSATQLVFTTSPQTILAGQPSTIITVQLQDQNHQPVQAGAGGVAVNLLSSSPGEMFLDTSGNPLPNPGGPSITIAQGSSSVSFEYEDSVLEMPTLTVASAGLLSATQQETIFANQVVTNTNDSGPGSLRDAMLHAAAGDTYGSPGRQPESERVAGVSVRQARGREPNRSPDRPPRIQLRRPLGGSGAAHPARAYDWGHERGVCRGRRSASSVQRRCGDFAVHPAGAFRCQTIRRR